MSPIRFGTDFAIDLGTSNTSVFAQGHGVVVSEPSVIAFNAASGSVEAVGTEARNMLGRSPSYLRPVRPIRDGVIADFDATEKMLTHFIRKAHRHVGAWAKPRANVAMRLANEVRQHLLGGVEVCDHTVADRTRGSLGGWAAAGAGPGPGPRRCDAT